MNTLLTSLAASRPEHHSKLLTLIVVQITGYIQFKFLVPLACWSRGTSIHDAMDITDAYFRQVLETSTKARHFGNASDRLQYTGNEISYSGSSSGRLCTGPIQEAFRLARLVYSCPSVPQSIFYFTFLWNTGKQYTFYKHSKYANSALLYRNQSAL